MVTGDNMLTALSVARECRMIKKHHDVVLLETKENDETQTHEITWKFADTVQRKDSMKSTTSNFFSDPERDSCQSRLHVAITGKTFAVLRENHPQLLKKVAIRGTVFARMAPDQKQQLIELLQDLGYFVGMCGDGANDCGALKVKYS